MSKMYLKWSVGKWRQKGGKKRQWDNIRAGGDIECTSVKFVSSLCVCVCVCVCVRACVPV